MSEEGFNVIHIGSFNCAETIFGMFDGSESFIIANPWFPSISNFSSKYHDIAGSANKNDNGYRLLAPKVSFKDPHTKKFDPFSVLAWTDKAGVPHSYYFKVPIAQTFEKDGSFKRNFVNMDVFMPDPTITDTNIILLSNQLTFGMTVLLVCRAVGIDLTKFNQTEYMNESKHSEISNFEDLPDKKNAAFMLWISDEVAAAFAKEKITLPKIVFDDEMIKSFRDPPVWGKLIEVGEHLLPVTISEDGTSLTQKFKTFWNAVRDVILPKYTALKKTIPVSLRQVFTMTKHEPIPNCRIETYIPEVKEDAPSTTDSGKYVLSNKFRIKINAKSPSSTYKLVTQRQVSETNIHDLTQTELMSLWGGSPQTPAGPPMNKGKRWSGCVYLRVNLDFMYYSVGCPTPVLECAQLSITEPKKVARRIIGGGAYLKADAEEDRGLADADAIDGLDVSVLTSAQAQTAQLSQGEDNYNEGDIE